MNRIPRLLHATYYLGQGGEIRNDSNTRETMLSKSDVSLKKVKAVVARSKSKS